MNFTIVIMARQPRD